MKNKKKVITDVKQEKPIRWTVNHPDGHVYVMSKIDPILTRFSLSQPELELRGWKFEPQYE